MYISIDEEIKHQQQTSPPQYQARMRIFALLVGPMTDMKMHMKDITEKEWQSIKKKKCFVSECQQKKKKNLQIVVQ